MPRLNDIVPILNAVLKTSQLKHKNFQKAQLHDIADLIPTFDKEDNRTTRPVLVEKDGGTVDVSLRDTDKLQIYHRILNLNYEEATDDNFGEEKNVLREVANMTMVMFGEVKRNRVFPEDLAAAANIGLPATLTKAQLLLLSLYSCSVVMGETILSQEEVFAREYEGVQYNLTPHTILIAVNYQIITVYNKACFSACVAD